MAPTSSRTPTSDAIQRMQARIAELEEELARHQRPLPPGARLVHLWLRTTPDVTRFIATRDTSEAAEAAWRTEATAGLLELESYPDGNGRRQSLGFRLGEVVGAAFDRPTAMAEGSQSLILPERPRLVVPS